MIAAPSTGTAGDEGEYSGEPEEERERVHELSGEPARPPSPAPSAQLVRPIRDQSPLGLPAREPSGLSAEVA